MNNTDTNRVKNTHHSHNTLKVISSVLAVVVAITTVGSLILPASALAKTEKVLDCTYELHQHSDDEHPLLDEKGQLLQPSCYTMIPDEDGIPQKTLTCGYADYVIHTHDDNCYIDGELVCTLPEIPEHKHDASCYKEEKVLVCGVTDPDKLTVDGKVNLPPHGKQFFLRTVRTFFSAW